MVPEQDSLFSKRNFERGAHVIEQKRLWPIEMIEVGSSVVSPTTLITVFLKYLTTDGHLTIFSQDMHRALRLKRANTIPFASSGFPAPHLLDRS
jgi:hypothetical protein